MGFAEVFTAVYEMLDAREDGKVYIVMNHPCEVCGTPDDKKPMCFQGEKWCSEKHRKQILGDSPQKRH